MKRQLHTLAAGLGLGLPARLLGFFLCGWPATDWPTGTRRPLSEKARWVEFDGETG